MIVIDASALAAILLKEPEADAFEALLDRAGGGVTHGVSVYEVAAALMRVHGIGADEALDELAVLMTAYGVTCGAIDAAVAAGAVRAFARFGKGRHPAALNMGDCFSYALAARDGASLLFKGADFSRTDVRPAV